MRASEAGRIARRGEVNVRRFRRFFGVGGIADRYERSGDELIEAGVVAQDLVDTVPELSREVVLRRIVRTAQSGEFGLRRTPGRNIVVNMVDLGGTGFAPGQYPLRPSTFTVELRTAMMRARRSVWVAWIAAQGWPVPPWYRHGVIDMPAAPSTADRPVEPVSAGAGAQRRPASQATIRAMLDELYEWANMCDGWPLDKQQAGRQGALLLRRRNLDASASVIQEIADQPRYAERRRKRGRPRGSKSAK